MMSSSSPFHNRLKAALILEILAYATGAGSELGEMVLAPVQEGWAYSGGQLGITYDGAVFASSQE